MKSLLMTASFVLFCNAAGAPRLAAQVPPATNGHLEQFVQQVVELWSAGDVSTLVELIPVGSRLTLDTGSGIESADGRHAAAALRALFSRSETLSVRVVRVTMASLHPARGFGELDWTFRDGGAPGEQTKSVYVAAAWQAEGWRISELRLMP